MKQCAIISYRLIYFTERIVKGKCNEARKSRFAAVLAVRFTLQFSRLTLTSLKSTVARYGRLWLCGHRFALSALVIILYVPNPLSIPRVFKIQIQSEQWHPNNSTVSYEVAQNATRVSTLCTVHLYTNWHQCTRNSFV
jgi:hypothetical protein